MPNEEVYIVSRRALPKVLLKVAEVKRMLAKDKKLTVQEATDAVGLSRSSFYKYKDDVQPFHETSRGRTVNVLLQVSDEPGILSAILSEVAGCRANVLTIQQSIPIGGVASVALGFEMLPETAELTEIEDRITALGGVQRLQVLGIE
ncbi:MAG: ACT domain-containing protein [Lachnospiraceae bacterium]|nr:ACT domain-containing protein [Lachnospiraceae bacterium]MBR7020936.1 ACT domain-containing protein [Lachnospiraceae bacterium]